MGDVSFLSTSFRVHAYTANHHYRYKRLIASTVHYRNEFKNRVRPNPWVLLQNSRFKFKNHFDCYENGKFLPDNFTITDDYFHEQIKYICTAQDVH